MLQRYAAAAILVAVLNLGACSSIRSRADDGRLHRFFLEVDRPGTVTAALHSENASGVFVRLLEIDWTRSPVGDTLVAWVQHYDGREDLSPRVENADLVVACFRDRMPPRAQAKHVLPGSRGIIYVYMMRGGILAITDQRIPFYEVLVVPGGSVYSPVSSRLGASLRLTAPLGSLSVRTLFASLTRETP